MVKCPRKAAGLPARNVGWSGSKCTGHTYDTRVSESVANSTHSRQCGNIKWDEVVSGWKRKLISGVYENSRLP